MRLLPWLLPLLPATNLVAASHFKQRQVSSLVGVEITILALLNDDLPQAVELDGVVSVDLSGSSDLATASPFILQDRTGYLYTSQPGSEVFSSGYAILVVPSLTSTDGIAGIELLDAAEAIPLLGTDFLPLVCTPSARGVLTCGAGSLGSTMRNFGTCYFGDDIIVYRDFTTFSIICGGLFTTITTFEYTVLGSVGGGVGSGASGGNSGAATSAAQGSCSVTVMLYLATSTTYVPVGHVGSSSMARGGSLAGVGCSPVTSTLRLN